MALPIKIFHSTFTYLKIPAFPSEYSLINLLEPKHWSPLKGFHFIGNQTLGPDNVFKFMGTQTLGPIKWFSI